MKWPLTQISWLYLVSMWVRQQPGQHFRLEAGQSGTTFVHINLGLWNQSEGTGNFYCVRKREKTKICVCHYYSTIEFIVEFLKITVTMGPWQVWRGSHTEEEPLLSYRRNREFFGTGMWLKLPSKCRGVVSTTKGSKLQIVLHVNTRLFWPLGLDDRFE